MKKFLKFFILPILHFIRANLTLIDIFIGKIKYALRRHMLPQKRNAPTPPAAHGNLFPYYDYDDEQRKGSYDHFKKYFKTSIFWKLGN